MHRLAALFLVALWAIGCTGGARRVDSCYDCVESANQQITEYCVLGRGTQLYCANPCAIDIDCDVGFWCVPLLDQSILNDDVMRWVCMPSEYYIDRGRVFRRSGDCSPGTSRQCPADMTCLSDDNSGAWFCSDDCLIDSDCLSGCCEPNVVTQTHYCLPWVPYCGT